MMKKKHLILNIVVFSILTQNLLTAQIDKDSINQINNSSRSSVEQSSLAAKEKSKVYLIMQDSTISHSERFNAANKLLHSPNKQYSQVQKEIFRAAIGDSLLINNALILLAGVANLNDETTYQELSKHIILDSLGNFNQDIYAYSREWCIHLALAKMGYPKHLEFVINLAKNEKDSHILVRVIFDQLFYLNNENAIGLLSEFIFSEQTFSYINEGPGFGYIPRRVYVPIAYAAYNRLSKLVANFPSEICRPTKSSIKCKRDTKSLKVIRKWVKKNRTNYQLNANYPKYFKSTFLVLSEKYKHDKTIDKKYILNNND